MTLLGQTIAMVVFVWFCMKFIWPPLISAIEERQTKIADGLAAAERGEQKLEKAQAEAEEVIADARKHAVLPWVGTVFCVLAALVQLTVGDATLQLHGLVAMDPVRGWLNLTVILCAATAMAGLQHSLGRDGYPGGEPYALVLLSAAGAMLMVSSADFLALFVGLELPSIAIYSTVALRRHRLDSGAAML